MASSERRKGGPARQLSRLAAALGLGGCLATVALAADLDYPVGPPGPMPRAEAHNAFHPHPNCRYMLQPRANLAGEVVRFRPSLVCLSRGLYADTLPPPPAPEGRPWWWLPWWRDATP